MYVSACMYVLLVHASDSDYWFGSCSHEHVEGTKLLNTHTSDVLACCRRMKGPLDNAVGKI